jgi:glutaredoxin
MNPLQNQSATPLCPYCRSAMRLALVHSVQMYTCICPQGRAATQKAILSRLYDDPSRSIPGDGPLASEPRK